MSRIVVIGLPGDPSLKLVNLDDGTVEPIDSGAVDASIAKAREAGATVFRGVDVAILVEDRQEAVGRFFFESR